MKIIIAPDSFKGSLSAKDAASAIERGIRRHNPGIETVKVPLSDGGEGTAQTLCDATNGQMFSVTVKDPLMRDITAHYAVMGDGETAVIEMAEASGLPLLSADDRNPLVTTTYGTGQLIKAALDNNCRRFIMAIGGSATNDGGIGMMAALGVAFLDTDGRALPHGGGSLPRLASIDLAGMDTRLAEAEVIVACDVDNPLCGVRGASAVFGPQKGATAADIAILDDGLAHYGALLESLFHKDVANLPGAGAAGGMGAALSAFMNGRMESGADIVKREVRFVEQLRDADLLLTGEGRIDDQTLSGKTPFAAALEANRLGIPAIAICGGIGALSDVFYEHFLSVHSIVNRPMTLDEAVTESAELLADAAFRVMRVYNR